MNDSFKNEWKKINFAYFAASKNWLQNELLMSLIHSTPPEYPAINQITF